MIEYETINTRYGPMRAPLSADTIANFLRTYGEWGFDEVRFISSVLRPEAKVADIGAFVGTFGLGLSQLGKVAALTCVEPNPYIAPLLRENLETNCRVPFAVVEAVIGPRSDAGFLGAADADNLGSMAFSPRTADPESNGRGENLATGAETDVIEINDVEAADGDGVIVAESLTLAELRERHGPFDLVKADVEGLERELLISDANWLSRGETIVWVECNEHPASLDTFDTMKFMGFDVHYFAFPACNPDNAKASDEVIFPWAYEAGLLGTRGAITPELDARLIAHECLLRPVRTREELREAIWRTPRWSYPDWLAMSRPEIVAVATRQLDGQSLNTFLTD